MNPLPIRIPPKPAVPTTDYNNKLAQARSFLLSRGIVEVKPIYGRAEHAKA